MKHILIYYRVDRYDKLVQKPIWFVAKDDKDAVQKQNHLVELGFKCDYYIVD